MVIIGVKAALETGPGEQTEYRGLCPELVRSVFYVIRMALSKIFRSSISCYLPSLRDDALDQRIFFKMGVSFLVKSVF